MNAATDPRDRFFPPTRQIIRALALTSALGLASSTLLAGGDVLSAGWGLDDGLPVFPDCADSIGRDGMPMVLASEVVNASLDAADFEVELQSGARQTPICVTLLPAPEENEDRTVLLIGDLGSPADPPRWARIVGELQGEDGSTLGGAVAVPDYQSGPSLVFVESAVLAETQCPADTAAALRLIFSGGVLSIDGDEFEAIDFDRFTVTTLVGAVAPIGFSDLNDFDNNLELCLATNAVVTEVMVAADSVIDPNGDANVVTSASASPPDAAIDLNDIWSDRDLRGDGFTIIDGDRGAVVYFFGYDDFGERLWLVSDVIRTHVFPGEPVSVQMYLGSGGDFTLPENDVVPWGELTIAADSCSSVRFELDGLDGTKVIDGERLIRREQPCDDSAGAAFQELYAQGVGRFLGAFSPSISEDLGSGVMTHRFSGEDGGPMCYTGSEFAMSTRDGDRDDLLIFLQGGGLCSPAGCFAVAVAEPSTPPPFGLLSATDGLNPASDFDTAYLPYCDGSLWSGDAEVDSDLDGTVDRSFRGLKNLSASLDVIADTYPQPSRILLAGNSAGGSGVHFALPLVRALYPGVPIELVNDSGVAILPSRNQAVGLYQYWNSLSFFPSSCANCIGDDGTLTEYYKWQLAQDASLRMAYIGSKQDATLSATQPGGGETFEAQLLVMIDAIKAEFPDQFYSLLADGEEHTFILRDFDYRIAGTSVRQWVADMLDGAADWRSLSD